MNEEEKNNENMKSAEDASSEKTSDETIREPKDSIELFKKKKRNGVYYNKRPQKELDAMQSRKSLFMYGSTLLFAVSLFLQVEGRLRFYENSKLFALFTAYVLLLLALIVFTVYIAFLGRTGQKIAPTIKEKYVQRGGLDRFTFRSYEWFNAMHFVLAAAEIAVSVYKIGVWGVLNIIASVGSAVLSLLSRNVLYKANAGQLTYVPAKEDE
ncbi:MAG: hypothetical protein K2M95_06080 [Clostridiales bacterium]|nr:hypothetical protein [Clostridiales bacterium]